MDRADVNPVAGSHSDTTKNRPVNQNKRIISIADFRFDYPFRNWHNINYGNIGAGLAVDHNVTSATTKSLRARVMWPVSAILAGLLVCCLMLPGQALANGNTSAVARAPVVQPRAAAAQSHTAADQPQWMSEAGSASWYGKSPRYKRTASGAPFNQNAMTAAHPWLPFGAKVRVTRRDTGHSIVVTINDRLPSKKHIIDLSVGAARQLGMLREGTTEVEIAPG